MASKTLYDILEVSPEASSDSIRAAYERLSATVPKAGSPDTDLRAMAMSEAFLTLSDPGRRAQYDKRLSMQLQPVPYTEVVDPFWTAGKLIGLALVLIVGGSFYYRYQRDEARLEAEKAVAAAKA